MSVFVAWIIPLCRRHQDVSNVALEDDVWWLDDPARVARTVSYSGLMIKVKQVNRLTQVDLNLFLIDLFFNFILKY
jgi:hypothetical protein